MPEALIHKVIRMCREGRGAGCSSQTSTMANCGVVDHTHELAACHSERSTPQKSLVDKAARREVNQ
jgi:hypothetical protein